MTSLAGSPGDPAAILGRAVDSGFSWPALIVHIASSNPIFGNLPVEASIFQELPYQ
jgi:hypothetical protein